MRRLSRWFMAALTGVAVLWILWAILSPLLPPVGVVATIGGLAHALVALHLLADAAERRGWIYYRKRQGSWDAVGAAMAEVEAIYRPGQHQVRLVKQRGDLHREGTKTGTATIDDCRLLNRGIHRANANCGNGTFRIAALAHRHSAAINAALTRWTNRPMNAPIGNRQSSMDPIPSSAGRNAPE